MSKLRSIQVLRAVAATAVVVYHAFYVADPHTAARVGAAGVDLFFVISGFIIATVAKKRSATEFLADRIWRIFPLWLIAVTPWLIVKQPTLPGIVSSLTLWPLFGNHFYGPALGVGWSLCFEMVFYGAFALALAGWKRGVLGFFVACLLIGSVTQVALAWFLGSPLILEFLAGVVIARLRPPERLALPSLVLGFLWLAAAPLDHYLNVLGPGTFVRVAYWGVPAALIVYGARGLERLFARREFDVPVKLGDASYSIYLFHPCVMNLGIAPAIVLSLVLGVLVHRLIERPLNELRRTWRSGMPVAKATPA